MTEIYFQKDIAYIHYVFKDWAMSETVRPEQ